MKTYRALKQHQEAKRPAMDKELSDIEVQVKHVDKRMIDVLNVIFNLSATFTGGTYAEKDKILAALFPQGFSIKNGLVRTPCVNKALEQMLGHSGTYEHIEITKGTLETENPPKGYQRYEGRTHIGLLHSLAG